MSARLPALVLALVVGAAARKEPFQMIDSKAGMSSGTAPFIADAMSRLSDGRQLTVVAALGPRRVGKSALLNHVFGAKFEETAPEGVWISPSSTNKDVLLVNPVPAESPESDLTHKRLASLCASLADVIVLNVWHTSSGRPTTATVDTLTALFAEALRQASEGGGVQRSLVLCAVQGDLPGQSPAAVDALRQQVRAIWAGMPKPGGLASSVLEDYFDFEFIAVPHYRAAVNEFKDAAAKLRARLSGDAGQSLLKTDYSKAIDAENFAVLAEQVWTDACAEADDGLAVTRERMRSCYVASKAFFAAAASIDRQVARWSDQAARKHIISGFGQAGKALIASALGQYDAATATCEPGFRFVASQRAKLSLHAKTELARLFHDQMRILSADTMSKLREALLMTVARQGSIQDWQVQNTQTSVERWFTQRLADLLIPDLALNLAAMKAELSQRLASFGSRFTNSATLQVQALQYLAERAKEGKAPKDPPGVRINYALTGAVRTAGTGNLQSFASYATGPYSVNFMLANDRDLPESAAATGVAPPTLRLQPKVNFDIDI